MGREKKVDYIVMVSLYHWMVAMYGGCDHFVEGTVDQDEVNHARMTHRETEDC